MSSRVTTEPPEPAITSWTICPAVCPPSFAGTKAAEGGLFACSSAPLETLDGDEPDPGAAVLDQRGGTDGGAVGDKLKQSAQLKQGLAEPAGGEREGVDDAAGEIARRRQRLAVMMRHRSL